MLTILNSLCHGYVVIPVIAALKKQAFFKALNFKSPTRLPVLVKTLKANAGYLKIALSLLESLGWVLKNAEDGYQLTAKAQSFENIPEDILELYHLKIRASLFSDEKFQKLLSRWIPYLLKQESSSQIFELLQGPILVPLLIAIRQQKKNFDDQSFAPFFQKKIKQPLRGDVRSLFTRLGWLKEADKNFVLSDLGREIIKRADVMGIAASYRPMLFSMSELLFGDSAEVFKKDSRGEESHIDRGMNVVAGGFQHGRYFWGCPEANSGAV